MNPVRSFQYALRSIARAPGYAVAFVLTLGLGIGANTAIFSVINGVLLEPLPYPDADRIMYMQQPVTLAGVANATFSFVEVADYRAQTTTVDEFVEFGDWTFNVVGRGEPHRATGGLVTSNYFKVLGLRPHIGRTLVAEDDDKGATPVAVLTHEYWSRVFGEDPNVLGTTIQLTDKNTTVVGVLEAGSHYAGRRKQDFYVNYTTNDHYMGASMQDERRHRMTDVFARLAPGSTLESARAEIDAVTARLHSDYPDAYLADRGYETTASPWRDVLTEKARPTLLILLGTVALVLVIASANVANLTLTRLIRRERELAIRAALGAGSGRLRRHLLTENLLLALIGAGLGLVVAVATIDLLVAYTSRFTLRTGEIGIDGTVLFFTLVVAIGVAVLFAWAPRMPFTQDVGESLQAAGGGRATGGLARRNAQRALVVSQIALSFMLLIGAGLMVRSLINLHRVEPGFELESVLTLEAPNFTRLDPAESRQVFGEVMDRVKTFPGVRSVATAAWPPFRSFPPRPRQFRVDGLDPESTDGASPMAAFNRVSHTYFETVGTPIVRGRSFTMMDDENSTPVVLINESMAAVYFGEQDPLGQRLGWALFNNNWSPWHTVIGVVADSKEYGLESNNAHTVYQHAGQQPPGSTLLVRTTGDAIPLARFATDVIHELDPNRPVDNISTLDELRAENMAPWRLNTTLFTTFALLALVIAAVGIAGVLAFNVSQRTNEFGIRMTLGADQGRVLRMVLREGAGLAVVGIALGGLGAVLFARVMGGLLYEVEPIDPTTFVGVALLLSLVAVTASFVPARRATQVDPIQAIRTE